jgi:hypothetical protein
VERQALQSETEVQGTLGYASGNDSASVMNVVLPPGTAPSAVDGVRQQVATAEQDLYSAKGSLTATNTATWSSST